MKIVMIDFIQRKTNLDREAIHDSLKLGFYYAIGLLNYYLFILVKVEIKSNKNVDKDISYLTQIFGHINIFDSVSLFEQLLLPLAGLIFGLLASQFGARLLLKASMLILGLGSLSLSLVLIFNSLVELTHIKLTLLIIIVIVKYVIGL